MNLNCRMENPGFDSSWFSCVENTGEFNSFTKPHSLQKNSELQKKRVFESNLI